MHFGFTLFYFSSSIISSVSIAYNRLSFGLQCLVLIALVSACGAKENPVQDKQPTISDNENSLTLNRNISVYDRPDGQPIQELKKGVPLKLTGEVSGKLYYQSTRKDTLLEPFIKVVLPTGELAWVYADPANFKLSPGTSLEWQWNNRLRSLLNPDEVKKYYQVWENWRTTEQAGALLLTFQATRELRKELEKALHDYPPLPLSQYQDLLPASWAYHSSDRSGWWLDYNQWVSRSATIKDASAITALFDFYQKEIYPPDGIEYHFTSWEFPVSAHQKHSLLGRQIHFSLLEKLQQLSLSYPFTEAECLLIKEQLIHDICDPGITYWEEWPAIESELDTILKMENWTILTPQDMTLIQHRIDAFKLPNMQELYLGQRSK